MSDVASEVNGNDLRNLWESLPMRPSIDLPRIPFAHAWQANHTGEKWHFAKDAIFSSGDIERGFVKNVTTLFVITQEDIDVSRKVYNEILEVKKILMERYAK